MTSEATIQEAKLALNKLHKEMAARIADLEAQLAAARAEAVDWHDPMEPPPIALRHYGFFLVAVKTSEGTYSTFEAAYLNAYPLEFEEGCGDCPENGSHDDGCPTTGWFSSDDAEDRFLPAVASGSTLLGWTSHPVHPAAIRSRAAGEKGD